MPVCTILNRQGAEVRRFATESPVIGSSLSVGRSSSCTIVLKHDAGRTVSRVHFVLEQRPVGWMLINKSSHGTYKGDRSIDQTPVSPGDVFQFGSCFFCFGEDARPSRYQLHWDDGGGGDEYAVLWPGRNTIGGASNNTIAVKQESVSRQHARITVNGDDVYLEDLNSSLGTFVGGKRVTALTRIEEGAQIRFGKARAWLAVGDVAAPGTVITEMPLSSGQTVGNRWLKIGIATVIVIALLALVWKLCF